MRGKGRHDQDELVDSPPEQARVDRPALLVAVELIHKLHDGADGRVEAEPAARILADLLDRRVEEIVERLVRRRLHGEVLRRVLVFLRHLVDQAVHAVQEPVAALHAGIRPVELPVGRRGEQDEEPRGIRTVFGHDILRADHVAQGLAHLLAVLVDHPLRQQVLERLLAGNEPHVVQGHHEEARVEQVQNRMLHPAGVLVYAVIAEPVVHLFPLERLLRVLRVAVAQEVPGGIQEGIHGVHLPPGRFAAAGADSLGEDLGGGQGRFPPPGEDHIGGQ